MRICVAIGSRADEGLLAWPIKCLNEQLEFDVNVLDVKGMSFSDAFDRACDAFMEHPEFVLLLGDRFEIMAVALAAHLERISIAHIAGGDVTEGSYDDAMRDCISRLSTVHFVTNEQSMARLLAAGYAHVHLVGSPGIDYIKHVDWLKARPYPEPYVVVNYQPETIDGTNEIDQVIASLPSEKRHVYILPNRDRGSPAITERILATGSSDIFVDLPHGEFLNLLAHCDEFIGNSSAIFYEAPELHVPTRLVGKRQRGRVRPWGDGHASERIVAILKSFNREQVSA